MKYRTLSLASLLDQLQKDRSILSKYVLLTCRNFFCKDYKEKLQLNINQSDREGEIYQPGTFRLSLPIGQGFCIELIFLLFYVPLSSCVETH